MTLEYEDDEDFDDEDAIAIQQKAAWDKQKEEAAARRMSTKSDKLPTKSEFEAAKKAQMLRDQAAVRAMHVSPGDIAGGGDPLNIDLTISMPNLSDLDAPKDPPPPMYNQSGQPSKDIQVTYTDVTFWTCEIIGNSAETDKVRTVLYSTSWNDLKTTLKTYAGDLTAKAVESRFKNSPQNILGYFMPIQHEAPTLLSKREFMIIIKDGKVFREEG